MLLDTLFLRVLLWLGAPPRSDPCRLRGRIAGHGGRSISRIQGIPGLLLSLSMYESPRPAAKLEQMFR